ncbi:hypothetical protein HPP92_010058 [Vanilla planifolia]|uniref:Hexosyltransferase n=1 Tax=Vanilla planifolia TaxID=51239 RepID=A0A835UZQ8_VANPL|nr:hypothetical protein HPP92_010058 [Vanilla planifolia]
MKPQMIVFHVITDKKTYPGMHSWFALNPVHPAIVEVKSVREFDWLKKENVPVLEAIDSHNGVRSHYHGNPVLGTNASDNPRVFASKLQARSPKYISLLNHLRIYLPELFPNLSKVVFLDDDVVVQRDLIPLWNIDLSGKVNGAVETCEGEDGWVGGESSDGQLAIVDASMDEGRSMEQADGVNCNANGRPIRECCKCGSLELEGSTVWWWIEQENST